MQEPADPAPQAASGLPGRTWIHRLSQARHNLRNPLTEILGFSGVLQDEAVERGLARDTFKGIKWSTERVFKDTMEVFTKKGYKVYVLPKLRDIDRIEDLRAFYKESKKTKNKYSKTLFYLSSLEDGFGL